MARSNEASLLSRASPLVAARMASATISFAIPLALARAFTPEDYGTYKQLFLVAQTLYYLLPLGMTQSLYFFLPRSERPRPYLMQVLSYLLVAGALALVLIIAGGPLLAHSLNNQGLLPHLTALGIYTLAVMASMPLEITLTAQGRTRMAAAAYVVSDFVKALAMTLPALLGYGLHGVMLGIAGFAVLRLLATWVLLARGGLGPAFERAALKAQVAFALPIGLAVAVGVPQFYFHQWVVSSNLDAAAFAVYAIGIFQVPLFDLLYAPTSEMLMVRVAELERDGRPDEAAGVFREAVLKLSQLFIPAVVLLWAIAPEFISTLFTERYRASADIFRVGVLSGLLGCLPVDGALRARGETRHILVSNLIKAGATIPLALWGVARFGMMGGVGSWLAAEVIGKTALMWRLPRAMLVGWSALIPVQGLWRPASASLLACVGVLIARWVLPSNGSGLLFCVVASMAYGAAYGGVLLALGARPPARVMAVARRALGLTSEPVGVPAPATKRRP